MWGYVVFAQVLAVGVVIYSKRVQNYLVTKLLAWITGRAPAVPLQESVLRGKALEVRYRYGGDDYSLFVPYNRAADRDVKIAAVKDGQEEVIAHNACLPFLVTAAHLRATCIRVSKAGSHVDFTGSQEVNI